MGGWGGGRQRVTERERERQRERDAGRNDTSSDKTTPALQPAPCFFHTCSPQFLQVSSTATPKSLHSIIFSFNISLHFVESFLGEQAREVAREVEALNASLAAEQVRPFSLLLSLSLSLSLSIYIYIYTFIYINIYTYKRICS